MSGYNQILPKYIFPLYSQIHLNKRPYENLKISITGSCRRGYGHCISHRLHRQCCWTKWRKNHQKQKGGPLSGLWNGLIRAYV